MPMDAEGLKSKMKDRIYNGLKKEFSSSAGQGAAYTPVADENWLKIASAVSEIATDIVMEITQNAQVDIGINVVGTVAGIPGPVTGMTITPGKIS
jgi:hypothetical protein